MTIMSKRDPKKSELERVAGAGWMVTLRYRLLLSAIAPRRETSTGVKVARWVALAGSAAAILRLKYG